MNAKLRRLAAPAVLLALCLSLTGRPLLAHPLAPTLLQLQENEAHEVSVSWKTSRLVPSGSRVKPHLPPHCQPLTQPQAVEEPTTIWVRWSVDCGEQGLAGSTIKVSGLAEAELNTFVRLDRPGADTQSWLLTGKSPTLRIPEAAGAKTRSKRDVAGDYAVLGIHHLLFGPDHVLLIIALMLIVASTRMLLITVTAFTIGHSVTLSLATLGWVHLPTAPLEAAIAASIMLVAAAIPNDAQAPPTALARRPWTVALLFGLLHGFGFSGALAEIGLPQNEIPLALLSFNIGIEIGQIAIVLLGWKLLRWWSATTQRGRAALTYAIGGLAGFWTLERLLWAAQLHT